ncbi:MAG: hypothetical protein ABIZ04_04370 [Opitutus sp.]
MKTKLFGWWRLGWRVLTEVPGWPNAPVWPRMQRAMPVLVPCTAMVLLLDWNLLIQLPKAADQKSALAPLRVLATEVEDLMLASSDQQARELAEQARQASEHLVGSAAEVPALLLEMKKDALAAGWEATFVASDPLGTPSSDKARVEFLPVRAKLVPVAGNTDVFGSFLGLTQRISLAPKRIDLVRLAIRADERHWQHVELGLRVVYPGQHEKTP